MRNGLACCTLCHGALHLPCLFKRHHCTLLPAHHAFIVDACVRACCVCSQCMYQAADEDAAACCWHSGDVMVDPQLQP
jgi:hypothetical protein